MLTNLGSAAVDSTIRFTPVGLNAPSTAPTTVTLQADPLRYCTMTKKSDPSPMPAVNVNATSQIEQKNVIEKKAKLTRDTRLDSTRMPETSIKTAVSAVTRVSG